MKLNVLTTKFSRRYWHIRRARATLLRETRQRACLHREKAAITYRGLRVDIEVLRSRLAAVSSMAFGISINRLIELENQLETGLVSFVNDWQKADIAENDPAQKRDQVEANACLSLWRDLDQRVDLLADDVKDLLKQVNETEIKTREIPVALLEQRALLEQLKESIKTRSDQGFPPIETDFPVRARRRLAVVSIFITAGYFEEAERTIQQLDIERRRLVELVTLAPRACQALEDRLTALQAREAPLFVLLADAQAALNRARETYASPNWTDVQKTLAQADQVAGETWRTNLALARARLDAKDWEAGAYLVERLEEHARLIRINAEEATVRLRMLDELGKSPQKFVTSLQALLAASRGEVEQLGDYPEALRQLDELAAQLDGLPAQLEVKTADFRQFKATLDEVNRSRLDVLRAVGAILIDGPPSLLDEELPRCSDQVVASSGGQ